MNGRTRKFVVAGLATVTIGVLGSGVAVAATSAPDPTAASTAAAPAKHHGHHRLRAGLHGEFTVKTKTGVQVRDAQRGSVTAVSPSSITLRSTDGFTATYAVAPTTKVRKDRKPGAIAQVAVGDRAGVVATKIGTAVTADRVIDRGPAKAAAPAPATTPGS